MKIEVGKSYRTRDGNKATILEDDGTRIPFWTEFGDDCHYLLRNGSIANGDPKDGRDLIAEWTEPDTPDEDGWITWAGGECPVPGDTIVQVRFNDSTGGFSVRADVYRWNKAGNSGDIVAYRIVSVDKNPLPVTMQENSLDKTLDERGKRYGKFKDHAEISQSLQTVMRNQKNWETLDYDQREALEMIAHKIARILNGDPNYVDSWTDVAGYAKLVADRLQGVER